ncbi:lamin tail domain-containing protein 2 [Ornithorhynchus anatinus]|uniref:lamin tail domain-containing protein 2 n=1 Tax=Ornithorhynchus anatinus TaxID=9258 RepID=UPI0010A77F9A|nr:lamin tail domain-containing protein 2 [Ornithorhynchus anatinus]
MAPGPGASPDPGGNTGKRVRRVTGPRQSDRLLSSPARPGPARGHHRRSGLGSTSRQNPPPSPNTGAEEQRPTAPLQRAVELRGDPGGDETLPPTGPDPAEEDSRHPRGGLRPSLDARTLWLLLRQKELELRALRQAARRRPEARLSSVLRALADRNGEEGVQRRQRLIEALQKQVEELSAQLEVQKLQHGKEKERLQERLACSERVVRRMEEELQQLEVACLLQLARGLSGGWQTRSSWVGRTLRSQTGSVETLTAEALAEEDSDISLRRVSKQRDFSAFKEEGLNSDDLNRLLALHYPHMFRNEASSSESSSREPSKPRLSRKRASVGTRSVEWRVQLRSESSSSSLEDDWPDAPKPCPSTHRTPPYSPRGSVGLDPRPEAEEPHAPRPAGARTDEATQRAGSQDSLRPTRKKPRRRSPASACLKIQKVDERGRFVRLQNTSPDESVDLGGHTLQRRLHGYPVSVYRFPPRTLLPPAHHITVWGSESKARPHKRPTDAMTSGQQTFRGGPGYASTLVSPSGEVLSSYRAPHRKTEASRAFSDDVDLSIDRFPLSRESWESWASQGSRGSRESGSASLARAAGAGRRGGPRAPGPSPGSAARPPGSSACGLRPQKRFSPLSLPTQRSPRCSFCETKKRHSLGSDTGLTSDDPLSSMGLPVIPETLSSQPSLQSEENLGPGGSDPPLPPVGYGRRLDLSGPLVALTAQKTAQSKYGFKALTYPPITNELRARV